MSDDMNTADGRQRSDPVESTTIFDMHVISAFSSQIGISDVVSDRRRFCGCSE